MTEDFQAAARAARIEWEAIKEDAKRYRWLKSAKGLELRSDGSRWSNHGESFIAPFSMAANNTRYGAFPSLDELIDSAMERSKS